MARRGHSPSRGSPLVLVRVATEALTNVMPAIWIGAILKPKRALLLTFLCVSAPALAQHVSLALRPPKAIEPASFVRPANQITLPEAPIHKFWDRKNSFLFATSAALSTADFVATRNNLRNGGQELNPVTRVFAGSTGGLAANFAGETMGVIGLSYLLHRSGHHKLERVVTIVNVGASATAVSFDLLHH
jgi:hypothetical protein